MSLLIWTKKGSNYESVLANIDIKQISEVSGFSVEDIEVLIKGGVKK